MSKIKPSVLVLGTYHMERGNRDMYQLKDKDIENNNRQQEIREVIECIKIYKPTKIAVEFETIRTDILEGQYKNYKNGKDDINLGKDEIYQIGFRLAKELGHENIYPVDWNRPPGGVPLGFVYEFLKESDPDLYAELVEIGEKNK